MKKYYPILKSKDGEVKALSTLTASDKLQVEPVIEVLPDNMKAVLSNLPPIWSFEGNSVLVDASYYFLSNSNIDVFIDFLEKLLSANVNVVPVVEFESPDDYINEIASFIQHYKTKVCIRVQKQFLKPNIINSLLPDLLNTLNTSPDNTYLLLDLHYINKSTYSNSAAQLSLTLQSLPNTYDWHRVIIAAGSFPADLSDFAPDTVSPIERYEWTIWQSLKSLPFVNSLFYGDYGIKNPIHNDQGFQGTSSVKYTTEESFVIYRGIKPGNHRLGNGQYHEKCKQLIIDSHYDGNIFSWADGEMYDCAHRTSKPGNAGTWVKIGHSRHISKLISLL